MKKPRLFAAIGRIALGVALTLGSASLVPHAFAEDIDIYQGTVQGGAPNVLFLLDNTANWSGNSQGWDADSLWNGYSMTGNVPVKGCKDLPLGPRTTCQTLIKEIFYTGDAANLKAPWEEPGYIKNKHNVELTQGRVQLRALRLVLNRLVCSGGTDALKVNIGLELIMSQTVRSNGDSNGIINFAIRPLTGTSTTSGSSCKALIDRLNEIDAKITEEKWKAPSSPDYGAALFEAFKYFGGYANPAGAQEEPTKPGSPTGAQAYGPERFSKRNPRYPELDDAAAFVVGSTTVYKSPITSEGACARNFLVLVGNTYPNAEPNSSPAQFGGLNYTPPTLPAGSSDPNRSADEWAYFLANTDVSPVPGVQRVFTYTINTYKNAPSPDQARLLRSMAAQGGVGPAGYLEVGGDLNKMVAAFSDILTSIAAVDSVFTAATLPVSTTTQGTYLNQVFVGMFRPDENAKPRWVGNLKQYKLGLDSASGDVMLVDAYGNPAILRGTGFFSPLARSYWTNDSSFFYHMPSGTPLSISDSPDGQIVEKGGAAQQLRIKYASGASGRNVFTLNKDGALAPFTSSNTAVTAVFGPDEISWIRGENTGLTETTGAYKDSTGTVRDFGPTGPRASIHGDVLHSRPVALNYGNGDIVVFYGGNDGFLRAVGGRQAGDTAGQELWSFVAPEFYQPLLKRLQSNSPPLLLPSTDDKGQPISSSSGRARKDYGMDGPIGVFAHYKQEVIDGKKVNVVDEAIIYASMRRGGRAVYALDVSPPNRTAPILKWKISNTSAGFEKLGQTWSTPKAVQFPGYSDPIVILGGGYDPEEDIDKQSSPPIGNVIYVINGRTGAKLAELATNYSVAGDVAVVDTDYNGVIDRGYVADVRGNLYRIDFTKGGAWISPEGWTIKQVAYLDGKVFTTPDIVSTSEFVAVLIGTGDREKPLLISTRDNFFLIKDKTIAQAAGKDGDWKSPLTKSDLTRFAEVDENTALLTNINTSVADNEGCYIELGTNGEKVVNSPYSIAGNTYFGTNRPTPSTNSCTGSLGQARTYLFPLFCRADPDPPKSIKLDSGGMPPSPVGGLVTITVDGVDRVVPFVIGAGTGGSPFEAERPRPPIPPVRTRQYWKIDNSNR